MIEIEELRENELDRWLALSNAVRPSDPLTPAMMMDWCGQADSMIWLLATIDGVDTAVGHGIIGWHAEPGICQLEVSVLESRRGHGLGAALLERLSAWGLAGDQSAADGTIDELDAASLAWAEGRGFTEVGRNSTLRLDLARVARPEIDPPDGIVITSWADRPDAIRGMYEVACETYPDVPGEELSEMAPFEKWRDNDLEGSSDRPEATFVALAEAEVVGYAKLSLSEALPTVAFHDITGVRRSWRGRGIAGALKRAEIAWAIDNGYAALRTFNEERNAPIRALNERHGYVVEPGTIRVRGGLTAAP
ncbi:GNAT family N-acetyltransferase [Gaiella sp.]|uniref:GNAT family N-acetyltransferase n=1 Tax=Gaiella sp. TaxID=2663207 RepID=UPI0032639463